MNCLPKQILWSWPIWWLMLAVNLAGSRIIHETNLPSHLGETICVILPSAMAVRGYLDYVSWSQKPHPKNEWHHFEQWGPELNEERKTCRVPAFSIPLQLGCEHNVTSCPRLLLPGLPPPWSKSQSKTFLPWVAFTNTSRYINRKETHNWTQPLLLSTKLK